MFSPHLDGMRDSNQPTDQPTDMQIEGMHGTFSGFRLIN